jgi:rubrerythrin
MEKELKKDLKGENEAIETYGTRKKEHPKLAPMYNEMQDDEKDHKRKLSKVLSGLKSAKPKDKD